MFIQDSSDRLAAALEGELSVSGDCLVLDTGRSKYAVAWHSSATRWHSDESAIEVNGVTAHVGDRVALGGGEMTVRADNLDNWEWLIAPSAECLAQEGVWFAWSLEHL